MKAFHGDPKVKEKYLARVKAHRAADEIVQGHYWQNGKGCAVGCTIHSNDHQAYETELGIPVQIARLQDWLFENLSNEEAMDFPVDFLESIPVGAALRPVVHQFLHWLLVDPEDGVIQYAQDEEREQVKEAILSVADLHNRVIKGQEVTNEQWVAAREAASDAALAASDAAWDARKAARTTRAAASAAWEAASTAAWAASDAAWNAREAAWNAREAAREAARTAARAAREAAMKRQKEKLLELLAGESVLASQEPGGLNGAH